MGCGNRKDAAMPPIVDHMQPMAALCKHCCENERIGLGGVSPRGVVVEAQAIDVRDQFGDATMRDLDLRAMMPIE